MPSATIASFAKKTGKSEKEVERLWKEAKQAVDKQYPDIEKDSDRYYALVTGILKKMVGLKENFNELVDSELEHLDNLDEAKKKRKDEESSEEDDEEKSETSDDMDDEEGDEESEKKKKKGKK